MVFGQRRRVQDGPGFDVHKDVRHILLGEPCDDHKEAVHATHYPLNTITTSKYTVLNFVPKNIWEQLHKAANAYFLAISVIMFIGNYTPLFLAFIKFYSTFAALAVMMIASGVIAALDDRRRHIADRQTNGQRGFVVQTDSAGNVHILDTKWGELLVGDVVIVRGEEEFPADLVPLASSGEDGSCYVSTANLDGETNLKLKMSASSSQKALCEDASAGTALLNQAASRLGGLRGTMRAEAPQKSIHNFTGSVTVDGCAEEALGPRQFLLRGTVLRNTAWVLGVVVYTGPHTRMVMNSRKAPSKLANLERVINASLLVVVGAQCVLALISDILYMATKHRFLGYWYLYPGGQTTTIILPEWIGYWLTFFVLYSNLMPISLYFTMEVCNAAQAWFIKNDLEMYDEEIDCPANARSTNLGHELGQVSYIFSDKTGTLTQNVMELKQVSIAGEIYGEVGESPGFHGGRALALARIQDTKKAAAIDAFLEVLAVSHTVVASTDQSGNLKYEAESPDEGALVEAVSRLGWAFKGRTTSTLSVEVGQPGQTQSVKYQVLALNAFTSKRKRQSVIVKRPSGEVVLLVKGADDIMQLKARDAASFPEEHLLSFAKEGLRTLVLGRRSLSETELAAWLADYAKAQTNMEDRDRTLELVAETIERDLEIVGVTAIEDKLQVGVQETIVKIREAGIKLWVLTGDKLETARNIGFSTRVLSPEMEIFVIDTHGGRPLEEQLDEMDSESSKAADTGHVVAMIVTGHALEEITRPCAESLGGSRMTRPMHPTGMHEAQFLKVAMRCSVVIACRVSPLQKSEMVRLVRRGVTPTPVTLAIGDGANDVPMIQEAQVGVGLSGKEGRQAVNSADFSIAQFRYLQRLLLVHGRWNYRRTCKFVIYSFWKNAVMVLLMFYYSFVSGFAGQSLFEDMVRSSYNFVLATPIIATGIFEQDVSEKEALQNPRLYECGRLGHDLNAIKLVEMLLSAIVHSCVIAWVFLLVFHNLDIVEAGDYYTFGTIVFTVLILAMNYRAAFVTRTWNRLTVVAQLFSFFLYVFFLVVYCMIQPVSATFEPWMYMVPLRIVSTPIVWIIAITVPALAIVIDVFKAHLISQFRPDRAELLLERWRVAQAALDQTTDQPTPSGSDSGLMVTPASQQQRRITLDDRMSSFDFGHPGGEPRHHNRFCASHPSAGDTSLVDNASNARSRTGQFTLSGEESASEDAELASQGHPDGALSNRPDDSAFSQQKMKNYQLELTWKKVMGASCGVGCVLLALAALVFALGQKAVKVQIQYSGEEGSSSLPFGGSATETIYSPCVEGQYGELTSCQVNVFVPQDMAPPINILSHLDPFYQNFAPYLMSGGKKKGWPQLTGHWLSDSQMDAICPVPSTRRTPSGETIFPCGLMATSMFNDTFQLRVVGAAEDLPIDEAGIAWSSDLSRFANPQEYGDPGVSWLPQRYPDVVGKSEGVRNERFADWMRPAAMPSMMKSLGHINVPLSKGQSLTLVINSRFPVTSIGVTKTLVLMTMSPLGGDCRELFHFLALAGVVCWGIGLTVLAINSFCPRQPGDARCREGMDCQDPGDESSDESSVTESDEQP